MVHTTHTLTDKCRRRGATAINVDRVLFHSLVTLKHCFPFLPVAVVSSHSLCLAIDERIGSDFETD